MFLAISAACVMIVLATRGGLAENLYFRRSAYFLLAFVTYFLLKALLDIPDLSAVKAMTVGTSGGMIFALIFGLMMAVLIDAGYQERREQLPHSLFTFAFMAICLLLSFRAYSMHLGMIRQDLFLVDVAQRQYQRPGDFLVIAVLIMSFQLARLCRQEVRQRLLSQMLLAGTFFAYLAATGLLLVTSQLIGSNKGFAVALGIMVGTVIWALRPSMRRFYLPIIAAQAAPGATGVFARSVPRYLVTGVVLSLLLLICGVMLLTVFGLEVQQFRIFGFSGGQIGGNSLASRFAILTGNFLTQVAVNPIFGNLRADELTTGGGSYAHSLVSILSHLGLTGVLLFSAYLSALYRELKDANVRNVASYKDTDLGTFRLGIILILLTFSLIATFFTWMPLWFAFGILFPAVVIRNSGVVSYAASLRASQAQGFSCAFINVQRTIRDLNHARR